MPVSQTKRDERQIPPARNSVRGDSHRCPRGARGGQAEQLLDVLDRAQHRQPHVRRFLRWAAACEEAGHTLRASGRQDIADAREAIRMFPNAHAWWGLVVFTCFGSLTSTETVSRRFQRPVKQVEARRILARPQFEKGSSVGHHRIQATLKGAKEALVSACANAAQFRMILLSPSLSFHDRFQRLRDLEAHQWGRTTCFDLVLRAGILGISGRSYLPDRAYLRQSRGPESGFQAVWGVSVTRASEEWCEGLLREWSRNWLDVAKQVGVTWIGKPYAVADLENALCIYQERLSHPPSHQSVCLKREPSPQRKC